MGDKKTPKHLRLQELREKCICTYHSVRREDGYVYFWYDIKENCPVKYAHKVPNGGRFKV